MKRFGHWMVTIIFAMLLIISNAHAQNSQKFALTKLQPDFNTVGFAKMLADEKKYQMSWIYDWTNPNADVYQKGDPTSMLYNPAYLTSNLNGASALTTNFSPVTQDSYQLNISWAIRLSDNAAFYIGGMESRAGVTNLLPIKPGTNIYTGLPWEGTTAQGYGHYFTSGIAFKPEYDSKLSFGAGISYVKSYVINGSWNGPVLDNGFALGLNLSAAYDFRDEVTDDGLMLGGGYANLSPFKLHYSATIVHPMPGRAYIGGGYKWTGSSNDEVTLAGDLGWITYNNMLSGAFTAKYATDIGDGNQFFFNGGYTAGAYFKGPLVGAGIRFESVQLNAGYVFSNNPNPVLTQLNFGVAFRIGHHY